MTMASTTTGITAQYTNEYRTELADRAQQWMDSGRLGAARYPCRTRPAQISKEASQ